MRSYKRWTEQQDAQLVLLHDVKYMSFKDIEAALDMPRKSASGRYHVLMRQQGFEPPRLSKSSPTLMRDALRDDEKARAAAGHTSITAAFFGDPLPGRSALDAKRAGAQA